MIAARRFAILNPVHTSNFIPVIQRQQCSGCSKCVDICPVEAVVLASANDPLKPKRRLATLIEDRCLGCGLCVRNCPDQAIQLEARPERVLTPRNGIHRTVIMAVERGMLQNLIFDNQALFHHRALAAVFGAILRLPPIQKAMASKQVKSRYLDQLIRKVDI